MTLTPEEIRLAELLEGNVSSLSKKENTLHAITKSDEPEGVKALANHLLKHARIFLEEERFNREVKRRASEVSIPAHKLPAEEIERIKENL